MEREASGVLPAILSGCFVGGFMSYIGFVIFSIIGIIISLASLLFYFAGFFSFEFLIGTAYLIIMYCYCFVSSVC